MGGVNRDGSPSHDHLTDMNFAITTLALLTCTSAASAQAGSSISYTPETYGDVSGDVPMRGLGLVLELVDARSDAPKLRLFGGPAGHPAAILIGSDRDDVTCAGGERKLIANVLGTHQGAFDWTGAFEVPLSSVALAGGSFFAQGAHASVFDLGPGGTPLMQFSNGLEVAPTAADIELGFEELLPHLPEDAPMLALTATLAERLQTYLNSPGDSARIELHIEGNGGTGAYIGGAGEQEILVERTTDGFYEVHLSTDLALTVGAEAAEGLEVGAQGGYGVTQVFRFHSAPGLARGLFGLLAAMHSPGFAPGRTLADTGLIGDAGAHVETLKLAVEFAQEHADDAEALVEDVLREALSRAAQRRNRLGRARSAAARRLAAASWRQLPVRAAQFAVANARFAAAKVMVRAATVAVESGERAHELAKAALEAKREELRAMLAGVARLHRIVSAIAQLKGYTLEHFAGTEVRRVGSVSADISVPLPVSLATLGAGVEAEAQCTLSAFFEVPDANGRTSLTVSREIEGTGTAKAAFVAGAEAQIQKTRTISEEFEFGAGQGLDKRMTASVSQDVQGRVLVGTYAAIGTGVGRTRSFTLETENVMDVLFDSGTSASDVTDDITVGVELQDRRIRTIECDLIISVAGNGGGFELDIEWSDLGPARSRSTTVADAIDTVQNAAAQLPSPDGLSVLQN